MSNSMLMTDEEHAYVVGRLDRAHIEELARQARAKLDCGETVELTYQPGDLTWYSLVLARVDHILGSPGGGGAGGDTVRSFIGGEGTYMLAYAQHSTVTFFTTDREDWEWIASQVSENRASAVAIAQLLEAVFA